MITYFVFGVNQNFCLFWLTYGWCGCPLDLWVNQATTPSIFLSMADWRFLLTYWHERLVYTFLYHCVSVCTQFFVLPLDLPTRFFLFEMGYFYVFLWLEGWLFHAMKSCHKNRVVRIISRKLCHGIMSWNLHTFLFFLQKSGLFVC